jgi:hypothetical protein
MADLQYNLPMAASTDRVLVTSVQDDTDNRFELQADGKMLFGNGTEATPFS